MTATVKHHERNETVMCARCGEEMVRRPHSERDGRTTYRWYSPAGEPLHNCLTCGAITSALTTLTREDIAAADEKLATLLSQLRGLPDHDRVKLITLFGNLLRAAPREMVSTKA